jgi:hypothetical protein
MRSSPPSAPHGPQQDTYLVLEDFGPRGRCWRASDEEDTDRETLIRDLFSGEYTDPVRIVAFNSAEGGCRDVTMDIARGTPTLCRDARCLRFGFPVHEGQPALSRCFSRKHDIGSRIIYTARLNNNC